MKITPTAFSEEARLGGHWRLTERALEARLIRFTFNSSKTRWVQPMAHVEGCVHLNGWREGLTHKPGPNDGTNTTSNWPGVDNEPGMLQSWLNAWVRGEDHTLVFCRGCLIHDIGTGEGQRANARYEVDTSVCPTCFTRRANSGACLCS